MRVSLPGLLTVLVVLSGKALAGDSIDVRIIVEGFRNNNGTCRVLLFDNRRGFPDSPGEAVAMCSATIEGPTVSFGLKVVPGKYAVAVLHDENSNGRLDKSWYGKPIEGFGASNQPKVGFGPPTFGESVVLLDENNTHLTIPLNYL